mgnify:CR=1 FL=1
MKKLFLIQISALLLIILTAAASGTPVDDKAVIMDLMEERIGILSYYYGGKMTFEDARKNIAKITAEGLFEEDVAFMEGFSNTEVDQITDYSLEIISCQRTSYGILKGTAQVSWILLGPEGYWQTEEEYYFTAECEKTGTKLTQLKKI